MTIQFGNPRQFRCCFCLHVRTGTIIFGVAQIILQLIFISALFMMTFKPGLFLPSDAGGKIEDHSLGNIRSHIFSLVFRLVPAVSDFQDSLIMPTNSRHNGFGQTKSDMKYSDALDHIGESEMSGSSAESFSDLSNDSPQVNFGNSKQGQLLHGARHRQFSPYIALCVTTFSLAFCCFLVHGAVTRQPTHLLPFFFLQVFDLIICLLSILGFMSSASDLRFMVRTKDGPVYINSTGFTFILLSISCMVLAFKAYCLGMVWDCYKYLMLSNRHGNQSEDWSTGRYGFLPTIWGLLGVGRRSAYNRNAFSRTDTNAATMSSDSHPPPIPATYDQSNDLPKYDDVLKTPANAYAPPPYFCSNDPHKTTPPSTAVNTTISLAVTSVSTTAPTNSSNISVPSTPTNNTSQ